MRAVVLDEAGQPRLANVPEPEGKGKLVRILACGLCGSDIEKFHPAHAGAVLGHEVVAATADGSPVVPIHHSPCGRCARCLSGHETTCSEFGSATIRPGGFGERARVDEWIDLPGGTDLAHGTMIEPLACVLRAVERVPQGHVLVFGHGFIGHLFSAILSRRGDEVFAIDRDPRRGGRAPNGLVETVVLCAPGGAEEALTALEPGGTLLLFADAGALPADPIYRRELTVLGSRSATPAHMREAARLLSELDLPEPTVLPLDRFAEGLDLYRKGEALKVVFTP